MVGDSPAGSEKARAGNACLSKANPPVSGSGGTFHASKGRFHDFKVRTGVQSLTRPVLIKGPPKITYTTLKQWQREMMFALKFSNVLKLSFSGKCLEENRLFRREENTL